MCKFKTAWKDQKKNKLSNEPHKWGAKCKWGANNNKKVLAHLYFSNFPTIKCIQLVYFMSFHIVYFTILFFPLNLLTCKSLVLFS